MTQLKRKIAQGLRAQAGCLLRCQLLYPDVVNLAVVGEMQLGAAALDCYGYYARLQFAAD